MVRSGFVEAKLNSPHLPSSGWSLQSGEPVLGFRSRSWAGELKLNSSTGTENRVRTEYGLYKREEPTERPHEYYWFEGRQAVAGVDPTNGFHRR